MRIAEIQELFDYSAWANGRILAAAADITTEQFVAPARFPGGSLRGCLLHVVNALRFHLACWQGQPAPPDLSAGDVPDLASLTAHWSREAAALRTYLATLTDADLDRPGSLTFTHDGVRATA